VIATNDPFRGGAYACDFAIVRPVFAESRLIAFAINVAHWLDVGGANASRRRPHIHRKRSKTNTCRVLKHTVALVRNGARAHVGYH